jgi:carbamoyltransferase
LEEEFEHYFGQHYSSPFMLFAHKLKESFRKPFNLSSNLIESINQTRSPFPAVTHVDFSSRIQTVNINSNPELFQLLVNFKSKTGFGILVNTSFNIKDEPIVCTPLDAINCFVNTEIDVLIINNFIIRKN